MRKSAVIASEPEGEQWGQLRARAPLALAEKLARMARAEGRTPSGMLRRLVELAPEPK